VTYLDFVTPLVGSQRQADATYSHLSSASDLELHTLLHFHTLSAFGLYDGQETCFRSYLTNRQSQVCVYGTLSSAFEVLFSVPPGSIREPALFKMFINDSSDVIT
jgi:hypothetical protein